MTTMETKALWKLGKVKKTGGFRREGYWVWCSSPVKGEDGRFHLFSSMWEKNVNGYNVPFMPNWISNSRVVRADSDTIEGPYTYREDVLPPRFGDHWDGKMTHNPTIHYHKGKYLLFYTGATYSGDIPKTALPREAHPGIRASQQIGLAVSDSVFGPWERYDQPILSPRRDNWDALMCTNPAVAIDDQGEILLLYKSALGDKTPMKYGVAKAKSYDSPFVRISEKPLFEEYTQAGGFHCEDAYIWWTEGQYKMIFKDMSDFCNGEAFSGAHASSLDGVDWQLHRGVKVYTKNVRWDDDSLSLQGNVERPQLYIEKGEPQYLFTATSDGTNGFADAKNTWSIVTPLLGKV